MNKNQNIKTFFQYVIPSVFSFALSGVYAIVDGYFVGNSIGDAGLSAVNIAYPVVAVIQAVGTGIGMGGAVGYSINKAEKNEGRARGFTACALWLLVVSSLILSFGIFFLNNNLLKMLGADGQMLSLGEEYIAIIALGAGLQVTGTGLVPFIRNNGGSFFAMVAMAAGFITNIILDFLFVWIYGQGVAGAALATYACIAYIICIIYLILQGVGDGSQPIISQYYGEKNFGGLYSTRRLAYSFAIFLSLAGCVIMYLSKGSLGILFGASSEVNTEISKIIPIFLVSVPFVAINRITTASFYATEKSIFSYILTFIEPLFMLILMLILPPLFGGQVMIWWSTVFARILSAVMAIILNRYSACAAECP